MKGGELGFMTRSQLVPELRMLAFALTKPKKGVERGRIRIWVSHHSTD